MRQGVLEYLVLRDLPEKHGRTRSEHATELKAEVSNHPTLVHPAFILRRDIKRKRKTPLPPPGPPVREYRLLHLGDLQNNS